MSAAAKVNYFEGRQNNILVTACVSLFKDLVPEVASLTTQK